MRSVFFNRLALSVTSHEPNNRYYDDQAQDYRRVKASFIYSSNYFATVEKECTDQKDNYV